MKNKITKIQTDYTYEVLYNSESYTVIQIEDLENGYLQWDIFDNNGTDLDEEYPDLREEIIAFIIKNA
jgi:hypothetical protein